ncbi:MAG: glycoside hydrolase family 125 protein [Euzebyales bacterium]|nr:glycoside hydrolase family 125 protein [Euzebyales bacterium]
MSPDEPQIGPLDLGRADKPLDVGNGRAAASVHPDGRIGALLGTPSPAEPLVLGAVEPLAPAHRHDVDAVRAYRAALAAAGAPAFGLTPDHDSGWAVDAVELLHGVVPVARLRDGDVHAEVTTWVPPGYDAVAQSWRLRTERPEADFAWRWSGPVVLGPPVPTELTEGGALPDPEPAAVRIRAADGLVVIDGGAVGAAALAGLPQPSGGDSRDGTRGHLDVRGRLRLKAVQPVSFTVALALATDAARAAAAAAHVTGLGPDAADADARRLADAVAPYVQRASSPARDLVRRGVAYLLGCCLVPAGEATCVLTDHRILPLSWTRDAYWCVRALLASPDAGVLDLAAAHVRWLFETAERPGGTWARAYRPDGRARDLAFQLDQQCYPLLELADLTDAASDADPAGRLGHRRIAGRLGAHVPAVLAALEAHRAPSVDLYATDETPADDPVPAPYHFSTHVLLWHTLRRLADTAGRLGLDADELGRRAHAVRAATLDAFTVERGDALRFAYAVDLAGTVIDYHDANDLPTAFAPVWGFCSADDPTWRGTVAWAFSPANARGFFPGPCGGLGSVHTPGAWPLGDVQELVVARLTGEGARERQALRRLVVTACWDGALPEARDPRSGAVRSRHWFAWPAAALVTALTDPRLAGSAPPRPPGC